MKAVRMLTHAIVRAPRARFAEGLTSAGLGPPDLERALERHERYCDALARYGRWPELPVAPFLRFDRRRGA